jgi:hypothetical protein
MIEQLIRIRCDDTGNTYWFPEQHNEGPVPQLWQLKVELRSIDSYGRPNSSANNYHTVIVERQTLVDAKCLPFSKDADTPIPNPDKSVEDLLLELLEKLNVRFDE